MEVNWEEKKGLVTATLHVLLLGCNQRWCRRRKITQFHKTQKSQGQEGSGEDSSSQKRSGESKGKQKNDNKNKEQSNKRKNKNNEKDERNKKKKPKSVRERESELKKMRKMIKIPAMIKQIMGVDRKLQEKYMDTRTHERKILKDRKDW